MSGKICPEDAKRRALKTLTTLAENAACEALLDDARAERRAAGPERSARMTDYQLSEALRAIGKAVFVRYYEKFADETLARGRVADLLINENGYNMQATVNRVGNARRIFRAGRARDALRIIAASPRLSQDVKDEAARLIR